MFVFHSEWHVYVFFWFSGEDKSIIFSFCMKQPTACCVWKEAASIFLTKSSLSSTEYILIIHHWIVLIMHGPSLTTEKRFQMPPANPSHHGGRRTGLLHPKESSLKRKELCETNKHLLISSEKAPPTFRPGKLAFWLVSLTSEIKGLRRTEPSISPNCYLSWVEKYLFLKDQIQACCGMDCCRATVMNNWLDEYIKKHIYCFIN